jgi:CDP-paratose 2-epimerase
MIETAMDIALVTGSAGLIGSETVRFFSEKGFDVVGIDNDMRSYFFGEGASTQWSRMLLKSTCDRYIHIDGDIRDQKAMDRLFATYGTDIKLIVHAAGQPSHDWAANEPFIDFSINADATLVLLELARKHCPDAVFIYTSTNKVYGDTPNRLPLAELETRWEIDASHPFFAFGIDESMTVDQTKHSLFGASKLAADILVQEYGRYFGMKTACFRCGCLTGPAHSGAELHGFLAYLVQCAINKKPYTIYGYQGKQVRDNMHSYDLANVFWYFYQNPKVAAVYNMGGSRQSNCSIIEAVDRIKQLTGDGVTCSYVSENRNGDHIWWISDIRKFQNDYPDWSYQYHLDDTIIGIHDGLSKRMPIG